MIRKLLKIVMWTVLGLAGLIIVVEIGDAIYLLWKYPEEFLYEICDRRPELYEIPDTIIDGPAPDDVDVIIPLQNLLIRDLSYREIIDLFGKDSVVGKRAGWPANSIPSSWESFPRIIEEKCNSLGEKYVTQVRLRYNDGSRDYLILWVYEDNDDMHILWGVRANEHTSLLVTTIYYYE